MANLKRSYADLLAVQERLRSIKRTSALEIELESDPNEPGNLDDLALALAAVRTNLHLVEKALNEEDRKRNGPEIRTRAMIRQDIQEDRKLLADALPKGSPRKKDVIEANIQYDELQLARSQFPGCG
ncbi:hypothetical protein ABT282_07770 [Streptomyces sp. NPDC000927]|uniref:hypothetical protein n=1 Tax=Streptomyces sp. NPDC000927 TaxID=3154371 RepID=UPI003325FA1D